MPETREQINDNQENRAYECLRQAIITGEYPPGARIVERDAAEKFRVSRTPIRTAIKSLIAEGLLEQTHNRGAIVKRIGIEEVIELEYVREALETMAVRLAVRNENMDLKRKLLTIVARMKDAQSPVDFLAYYRLSGEFHALVLSLAGNSALEKLVKQNNIQVARFQFRNLLLAGRVPETIIEHEKIAQAIYAGDQVEAVEAMRIHIQRIQKLIETEASKESPVY